MKITPIKNRVLYNAFIDDDLSISFTKYVLRSARLCSERIGAVTTYYQRVLAIAKIKDLTWVKLSKNHGDFGWASYIPSYCKHAFSVDAEGKIDLKLSGLRLTKKGALKVERKRLLTQQKRYPDIDFKPRISKLEQAIKRHK